MTTISVDHALVHRMELAEGAASVAFVEAHAKADPAAGATWMELSGTLAMFDGVGSPLTQTFGIGLHPEFERSTLLELERFFDVRGAASNHEVSTHASPETTAMLAQRGYVQTEESTVLVRMTDTSSPLHSSRVTVRRIGEHERDLWTTVSARGWSSVGAEVEAFVLQHGQVMSQARGVHCFIAELDGEPIAAAALNLSSDMALLAGASTVPSARGNGAQRALLETRLAFAASRGVELAMIAAQPDSASQRNAERAGFQPVYGRTKWERPARME